MAKENDLTLTVEDSAKPSKKKLILIVAAVSVVLLLGAGTAFFLLSGQDAETTNEEVSEVQEPPMAATFYAMKPDFIVNYQVNGRQHFAQVGLYVVTRKQSVIDALELHTPMLRNEVLRLIGEVSYAQLRTAVGKKELQQALQQRLVFLLKKESQVEGIDEVLYSNFIMQ